MRPLHYKEFPSLRTRIRFVRLRCVVRGGQAHSAVFSEGKAVGRGGAVYQVRGVGRFQRKIPDKKSAALVQNGEQTSGATAFGSFFEGWVQGHFEPQQGAKPDLLSWLSAQFVWGAVPRASLSLSLQGHLA